MRPGVIVAIAALAAFGSAKAEVCMKSGEETSGFGKVCSYHCTFGETSQNVSAAQMCPLTVQASPTAPAPARRSGSAGVACFKVGEQMTQMTKQCVYDCGGARRVETVGAAQLCPITVR
ncbi:MAG: hypothetical protein GC203_11685 [Phenylobacterium sp.]|uniref:hypothetical protein n=1 Tax=Phenylobacterium sp. TaxID=1871053 RepID=UPI0025D35665|nr:hypothetical protein [Phenylobacterium sp.]MBI1198514.1 hypothetical protein [Phenylobacterium sp.]